MDINQVYMKWWIKHDLRLDGIVSADVYENKMQQSSSQGVEFNIVTKLKQKRPVIEKNGNKYIA